MSAYALETGDICTVNQENQIQIWSNLFSLWFSSADQIPFWKTLISHSHAFRIQAEVFFLKRCGLYYIVGQIILPNTALCLKI